MNQLYVYRITGNQAQGNQIDIPKPIAKSFFNLSDNDLDTVANIKLNVCHINNLKKFQEIEIQTATNPRFSTSLNTFLTDNGDELSEDDLLVVEKIMRSYSVRLIKKSDMKYSPLVGLFEKEERSMQLTAVLNSSLSLPLQRILYGAPGTGKSYSIKSAIKVHNGVELDMEDSRIFRTTFHPDYDYAQFVGCYKPKKEDDKITYEFVPQVFTNALVKAYENPDESVYLVIEEINRGNCAQIFGDIFQLLDRNSEGESEYSINVDEDLKQYLEEKCPAAITDGKIKLPRNFNIIATMNTSDQSLFPIDSAFKRRWEWEYVPIDYDNEDSSKFEIKIGDKIYQWHAFLKAVNQKIKKATKSEDKQMGNFFIRKSVDEKEFCNKVMFYLWNDVSKDYYESNDSLFQYIEEDSKSAKHFSFNELFGENQKELLNGFMKFIGCEKAVKELGTIDANTNDNADDFQMSNPS